MPWIKLKKLKMSKSESLLCVCHVHRYINCCLTPANVHSYTGSSPALFKGEELRVRNQPLEKRSLHSRSDRMYMSILRKGKFLEKPRGSLFISALFFFTFRKDLFVSSRYSAIFKTRNDGGGRVRNPWLLPLQLLLHSLNN